MPYCFAERPRFYCSKSKIDFLLIKKQIFRRLISPIFFSLRVDCWFDTPDWRILQERQGNHSNSKNDNRKTKLLRKRNHFSSKYFSGSSISCCKNPEENFSILKPYFFHLKVRTGLQFNFEKKLFFLKTFRRYVVCSFDNHVVNFSLKLQISLLKN